MIYNIIIILLTINLLLNIYLIYLYKHNKFIIWEFNNNDDDNDNDDIDYIIEPYNIKKNNLNFSTKKEIIQLNGIYRNKNTNSRIF